MKRRLTLYILFVLPVIFLQGQQQHIADSLRPIYEADTVEGKARLELLRALAYNESNNPDDAKRYAEELLELARELDDQEYLYFGYLHKGNSHFNQKYLDVVLEAYNNALTAAKNFKYPLGEGIALYSLAFTYAASGDNEKAEEYFGRSIAILRQPEVQNSEVGFKTLGETLFNSGDFYLGINDLEKARPLLEEAGEIFERIGYRTGYVYFLGNMAVLNEKLGNLDVAKTDLIQAIEMLVKDLDYVAASEFQANLADIYAQEGDLATAHDLASTSLGHALRLKLKDQISTSSLLLAQLDRQTGNFEEAYDHLNLHMQYKDSLGSETVDMTRLELRQTENEMAIQALNQKRQRVVIWAVGVTALLLVVVLLGSYRRYRYIKATNLIISQERDRSDQLLLNILPKETAQELKKKGRVRAQRFESVTVLFSDFKGFTSHAEAMAPEDLVESIDFYFSHFDTIMEKYGLEKIKTVGDAYMCAGGLPFPVKDHAVKVVEAAQAMLEFVETNKADNSKNQVRFEIRIGINSGPVVAGVVGTKKFAYDIWGDTVNIASRMESSSEVGKINIAEATFQLIKETYECQYRGSIAVKNHGELDMYFVLGKKEATILQATPGASWKASG